MFPNKPLCSLIGATDATIDRAFAWVKSAPLNATDVTLTPTRDAVWATIDAEAAGLDGKAPSVPSHLASSIDFVLLENAGIQAQDTTVNNTTQQMHQTRVGAGDGGMGLAAQKKAYGVPPTLIGSHGENLQMVWGTGTYGYRTADLALFYSQYCKECDISVVKFDKEVDDLHLPSYVIIILVTIVLAILFSEQVGWQDRQELRGRSLGRRVHQWHDGEGEV